MTWLPIPLQELEPCIPSRRARDKQAHACFSRIELAINGTSHAEAAVV
jgi:hypothetical protein